MIFGEYPCCGEYLCLDIPDNIKLPVWQQEKCPHCGVEVWHNMSRVEPYSTIEKPKTYERGEI